MFNLTRSRHFSSKGVGKEIYPPHYGGGPCFGAAKDYKKELEAWIYPFNYHDAMVSHTNGPCFGIPRVGRINMLTNMRKNYFEISEMEVWEVKEIEELSQ